MIFVHICSRNSNIRLLSITKIIKVTEFCEIGLFLIYYNKVYIIYPGTMYL